VVSVLVVVLTAPQFPFSPLPKNKKADRNTIPPHDLFSVFSKPLHTFYFKKKIKERAVLKRQFSPVQGTVKSRHFRLSPNLLVVVEPLLYHFQARKTSYEGPVLRKGDALLAASRGK